MTKMSDLDIVNIKTAEVYFNQWLKDEKVFIQTLINSSAMLGSFKEIYSTYQRLGEVPSFTREYNSEEVQSMMGRAWDYYPYASQSLINSLTIALLVLGAIAERGLKNLENEK